MRIRLIVLMAALALLAAVPVARAEDPTDITSTGGELVESDGDGTFPPAASSGGLVEISAAQASIPRAASIVELQREIRLALRDGELSPQVADHLLDLVGQASRAMASGDEERTCAALESLLETLQTAVDLERLNAVLGDAWASDVAALQVSMGCIPLITGSVTDPAGDATDWAGLDPDPDLVSATVSSNGVDLILTVGFAPGTFDESTAMVDFLLDTDQDTATGHPGTDAGCTRDASVLGTDFIVKVGVATLPQTWSMSGCNAPGTSSFAGTFAVVENGYEATVPISLIGADDGVLNFKVISFAVGTNVLDYMPDTGLASGVTAPE